MNTLRVLIIQFCLVILLSLVASCNKLTTDTTTLRVAHGLDTQHPVHKALLYMNEQLVKYSNSKMNLAIYPSGQLGSEREIIELLQIGTMDMTKVSASSLEAFVPQMKIFSLPYLFNDQEHYWHVLNSSIGEQLLASGEKFRIKGLGYFDAGSRNFYTTHKKVTVPKDLNGLKIRVMNSESAVTMVNTMGGAATPVSWGELYTALQQGIVDGAENNLPSFYYSKHYEVSKYYLIDEHTSIPDVIVISTYRWKKLSTQQQSWLTQAMRDAMAYQRTLWNEATEMALTEVKKSGVEVIRADKSTFQQSVEPIYKDIEKTPLAPLVKQIKMMGEK